MGAARRTGRSRRLPSLALVAALALGVVACTGDDGGSSDSTTPSADSAGLVPQGLGPPPPGTFRLGVVGLEHLDPAFVLPADQSAMIAADLLFDGLTAYDPVGGTVAPALAESWTADEAQAVWTFTLRADATFADGSPVTAADVKASLERVARLGNISLAGVRLEVIAGYAELLAAEAPDLAGVVAVDERTVEIRTLGGYAPLPALLASPLYGVVPGSVLAAGDEGDFDAEPVASGPYAFVGREREVVTLEARAPDAPVPTVELAVYPDAERSYAAFEDGDLDWAAVPAGLVDEAGQAYGRRAIVPFLAELAYGFNLADPALEEPRLRLAVARAIDRQALLDEVLESAVAATGMVPPGVPGSVPDACGLACAHDPAASQALLAEAYPDGQVPSLRLDVFEDPVEEAVAERVAADLEAVGIPVEVVVTPFDQYRGFIVSGAQQLFTFGWVGVAVEPDVFLAPLFLSGSPDNVTGLADGVVDLAITVARGEPDPAARNALYGEVDRQVMAQVPMVPLAVYETAAVLSDRVENYVPRPDGTFLVLPLRLAD